MEGRDEVVGARSRWTRWNDALRSLRSQVPSPRSALELLHVWSRASSCTPGASCHGLLADMTFSFELFEWSRWHIIHRSQSTASTSYIVFSLCCRAHASCRALKQIPARRLTALMQDRRARGCASSCLVRANTVSSIEASRLVVRSYSSSSHADFMPSCRVVIDLSTREFSHGSPLLPIVVVV
jgi:hypothetical protein